MVIDTSALLAVFFNEPQGSWVSEQLQAHHTALRMSTVNLAETLILIKTRQPQDYPTLYEKLTTSTIRMVPPSQVHAEIAAETRLAFPLNLGDGFAYALAKTEGCPLLTLDRDFLKTDAKIVFPN